MKKILIVVTSHGMIEGEPRTGIWFTEFLEPYEVLVASGAEITVASPLGGPAPVDPRGYPSKADIVASRDALELLNRTRLLDRMVASDFDAIFMPGGHGPMFDLATLPKIKSLIAEFWEAGKAVGAVCHGPASLLNVPLSDGSTLLHAKRVTGFSHEEDEVDALFQFMPFSLESRMRAEGANYISEPPRTPHVEVDGRLITGQNPASATVTAAAFLTVLTSTGKLADTGHIERDEQA